MSSNLLTSRSYNTADHPELCGGRQSWYSPREFLQSFPSIVDVVLTDTTNSGGCWGGYIAQKIGKRTYIIPFNQENNYPRAGYAIYTADSPLISFIGDMSEEEITTILYERQED